MQILVNGEDFKIQEQATLAHLIELLELSTGRYAIEVNEQIVPRSEQAAYHLASGDKVEVVQAIGGG